jgi:hypothetical protein
MNDNSRKRYRETTNLTPSEKVIIQRYSEITGESKSSFIHIAIKKAIKGIPEPIMNQIKKQR